MAGSLCGWKQEARGVLRDAVCAALGADAGSALNMEIGTAAQQQAGGLQKANSTALCHWTPLGGRAQRRFAGAAGSSAVVSVTLAAGTRAAGRTPGATGMLGPTTGGATGTTGWRAGGGGVRGRGGGGGGGEAATSGAGGSCTGMTGATTGAGGGGGGVSSKGVGGGGGVGSGGGVGAGGGRAGGGGVGAGGGGKGEGGGGGGGGGGGLCQVMLPLVMAKGQANRSWPKGRESMSNTALKPSPRNDVAGSGVETPATLMDAFTTPRCHPMISTMRSPA